MVKCKILIFPIAQQDLIDIIGYLSTLSPQVAIKFFDLITEEISKLSDFLERCPLIKDSQLRLRNYRGLKCKNYLIFYVIAGDTVEIRRILYNRRQYEKLL